MTETTTQRAGRRIVYSYAGPTPPDELLGAVADGTAAGVIFFAENVDALPAAVAALVEANGHRPPLFLTTDQEGGRIRRLPGGPARSAREVADGDDPHRAARETGREAADTLEHAGLTVNLAPVLDVSRASGDFTDHWERGYGRDPDQVGRLAAAFTAPARARGIASVAKHFPGLGTAPTRANTDLGPVRLEVTRTELEAVDLRPYRSLIADGIDAIMPSWAVYPDLDPDRPAGMSAQVLRILRNDLGFTGVVVSDALEAGALDGDTGDRAVAAARAGVDLLLCSARDVAQGRAATQALAEAESSGVLSGAAVDAALARVDTLRRRLR